VTTGEAALTGFNRWTQHGLVRSIARVALTESLSSPFGLSVMCDLIFRTEDCPMACLSASHDFYTT